MKQGKRFQNCSNGMSRLVETLMIDCEKLMEEDLCEEVVESCVLFWMQEVMSGRNIWKG